MVSFVFRIAEAACSHVVELAQAEVNGNPRASPKVRRFAAIKLGDAEVGVHKIFQEYGLSSPIPVYTKDIAGLQHFPYMKFSDWVRHLLQSGQFARQLVGCSTEQMPAVLTEFWQRYQRLFPGHEVFQMGIDMAYTVPYYSHTDEGRSQKHDPIWVLSCHGALGRGTRRFVTDGKHRMPIAENEMGLNFLGQTFSTQFLVCTLLKKVAGDYPGVLSELIDIFAADASMLIHEGIDCGGLRFRLLHLGSKGDLPALGKLGNLCRTFSHVPRRPSTKTPCEGICHLCCAGQEANAATGAQAYPFEDLTFTPCWEQTMHTTLPWETEPGILANLPLNRSEAASFFCIDIWHCFHLGVCKHWVANSLVTVVESTLLPPMSVERKFESITAEYQSFCRRNKLAMWITDIGRDSLTWPQSSASPIGKWNKGSASTTLMLFLAYYCANFITGKTEDPLLLMIVP